MGESWRKYLLLGIVTLAFVALTSSSVSSELILGFETLDNGQLNPVFIQNKATKSYYVFMNETNTTGQTGIFSTTDYYNISDFQLNMANGFTLAGNGTRSTYGGTYLAVHSESYTGGTNNLYRVVFFVNENSQEQCESRRLVGTGQDVASSGANCILTLNSGDLVTLRVRNPTASNNASFEKAQFSLTQINAVTINSSVTNTSGASSINDTNKALNVTDGTNTAQNVTLINFTSGATVTANGNEAKISITASGSGVTSLNRINDTLNRTWVDTESGQYDTINKIMFGLNSTPRVNFTYLHTIEAMTRAENGQSVNGLTIKNPSVGTGSGSQIALLDGNSNLAIISGYENGVNPHSNGVFAISTFTNESTTWIGQEHFWINGSQYMRSDLDFKFPDNIGTVYGDGLADLGDAKIYWDSSDLIIESKNVDNVNGATILTYPYASMYVSGGNNALDGAPTNLTAGWTQGLNDSVDIVVGATSGAFIIKKDGRYKADWNLGLVPLNVSGTQLYFSIEVNGMTNPEGRGSTWLNGLGQMEDVGGTAILALSAGDVVWLAGLDPSGQGADILFELGNFNIERVGENP